MRWSWVRAAILGILIGPASYLGEPAEAEEASPGKSDGYVIHGLDFHVWDEDAREAASWGVELVAAGGHPAELASWRRVAERTESLPPILTDDLQAALASWGATHAEAGDGSSLGWMLCLLPALDRTCLIASWATSRDESIRRALAHALAAPFRAVGAATALEHLREDPSAEVRRLARSAAAQRRVGLG